MDNASESEEGRIKIEGERYVGWRDRLGAVGSLLCLRCLLSFHPGSDYCAKILRASALA